MVVRLFLLFLIVFSTTCVGRAEEPSLVLNPRALESRYRLALGVSYTGLQMRYQFGPKWAAELRAQFGSADSIHGPVEATVIGLRGNRFIPYRRNLAWYFGGEIAHAEAKIKQSVYKVNGVAAGAFMGMEYRILPRLAVGADIGPYVIALEEQRTHIKQTSLDFVINTALNFYVF